MDDKALLAQFIDGDEAALQILVERYQKALYAFIYRQVGDVEDAADLTQKAFVNVFLKVKQFEGKASFKTWLYQIAVNLCKNHFRANHRNKKEIADFDMMEAATKSEVDQLVFEQQRAMLRSAVAVLPEKQRVTVQLRLYQDCTFTEIADIMSCSVGTAKACYHQAVKSLQKIFIEGKHATSELCNS